MVAKVCCFEFSKSIFWVGVEEFIQINNFFCSATCLEKMKKKLTANKISLSVPYQKQKIILINLRLNSPLHII